MYGGVDANIAGTTRNNSNNRETLHITPHISAHKSSIIYSPDNQITVRSNNEDCSVVTMASGLIATRANSPHIQNYKLSIPNTTIFRGGGDLHLTEEIKIQPQDLSAHSQKAFNQDISNTVTSIVKPLPHIHTVESMTNQVIIPERPKSPVTYYRLIDGTTFTVSGQHPLPVLLSSVNEDEHCSPHQDGNSTLDHPVSVATALAVSTVPGTHSNLAEIIIPDVISSNYLSATDFLPNRGEVRHCSSAIKVEEEEEEKDLVRQALQEAVVQNNPRMSPNNQVINYNYSNDDITGSQIEQEDIVCHSTICHSTNLKHQDLLMMSINLNTGQTTGKLESGLPVVLGPNVNNEMTGAGGQVVVIQQTDTFDGTGSIISTGPLILSTRSKKRTKLSEEAQAVRRVKIANRMREKRANESDEQKERRRIREAERMRKKRAQEDELSKERRRREAAERARIRRSKLSQEEKELERKKAAARMRMRRQNENEEQKRMRRIKAAERMRKRRATETPEEKANRKENIVVKTKVRRKKKNPEIKPDDDDSLANENSSEKMIRTNPNEERGDYLKKSSPNDLNQHTVPIIEDTQITASTTYTAIQSNIVKESATLFPSNIFSAIGLVPHQQQVSQASNILSLPNQPLVERDDRPPPPSYHREVILMKKEKEENGGNSSLHHLIPDEVITVEGIHPHPHELHQPSAVNLQKVVSGTHHNLPHIIHNLTSSPHYEHSPGTSYTSSPHSEPIHIPTSTQPELKTNL